MTRLVSRAESFETIYQAFENINFSAFDFFTIKESLIDYIKLQFPESFNDYIESSEFIAILELFAYIGETNAYRLDVVASENFITQAERKESILRLAKFLSYKSSRNLPARGLVKIQSIKSTEDIFDINGSNLANRTIRWNDPNNVNWKEQFLLVINKVLKQTFGSVAPDERVQVNDVLFELYDLENNPLINGIFPLNATISGQSIPLELVPVQLDEFGPLEKRPENNSNFSILYGSDGLGDGSDTTGFFVFLKQGQLQSQTVTFDGITPNQTHEINIDNINDTDIWINKIDSDTGQIIDDNTVAGKRSGEWVEVDLAHAQNIIFNTNPNRNKYEIESLENDQIKIIFGDGEFANIPSGLFNIWLRTSANENIIVPQNTIVNKTSSFTYNGLDTNTQTFTFSYSLINSLQNAAASEKLEHIRRTAPAVYYTQDRMVNGRDYNTFMLQDISILKLRSINRTFAGDSKYIGWRDPKEHYEDVKLFGDDLAIYYKINQASIDVINEPSAVKIIENYIEPLLNSSDFFLIMASNGIDPANIRSSFTITEKNTIVAAMDNAALNAPETIHLFYSTELDEWVFNISATNVFISDLPFSNPGYDETKVLFDWNRSLLTGDAMIKIEVKGLFNWKVIHKTERIVTHSPNIRFWNTNDANRVLSFDTLFSNQDEIILLSANENANRELLLNQNYHYNILGQERVDPNIPNTGLIDIHQLSVLPIDTNNDTIPDNLELSNIINPTYSITNFEGYQEVDYNNTLLGSNLVGLGPDTAGYQEINYNSTIVGTNIIGNGPSTAGYQEIDYGATLIGTNLAGVPAGNFDFSINIDASGPVSALVTIVGTETIDQLIILINRAITGATASIVGGQLRFTSNSTGLASTIFITNGTIDLFSAITGYLSINNGIQGTNPPGLEAATYDFTIDIDSLGAVPINITVTGAETFNQLIILINGAITGATASIVAGQLRFTSNSTGLASTILLGNGTTLDLFSEIENYFGILSAIIGTEPPGLTNAIYDFTINIDNAGIIPINVTVLGTETFDDLLILINAQLVGARVILDTGQLRFISNLQGSSSSIILGNGTTLDLFAEIENYVGILQSFPGVPLHINGLTKVNNAIKIPFPALFSDINLTFSVANDAIYDYYNGIDKVVEFSFINPGDPSPGNWYWFDLNTSTLMEWNGSAWIVSIEGPTLILGKIVDEIRFIDNGSNPGIPATPFRVESPGISVKVTEYVYFQKTLVDSTQDEFTWLPMDTTLDIINLYYVDFITQSATNTNEWKRENGRFPMNFLWMHRTPRLNLIDPAASNIIDTYIITRAYYTSVIDFINDRTNIVPTEPTPLQLSSDYNHLLDNKMISDTLILHSGKIKILFGNKAIPELKAVFKIIRSQNSELSNNQLKVKVINIINVFFDINNWEFGETFYFTELASKIHVDLISDVATVVLVPLNIENLFGDLFVVKAKEDEIFQPHVTVSDVEIVESLNPEIIRQGT